MLNFLNDEYIRSTKVLNFINNSSKPVSIDEIAVQVGSVRKTVATMLSIIKSDLSTCNFDLRKTNEKKYYLVSKEKATIYLDDYLLICAKRSLLFSMVEELFNKGRIHTIQFCNDRYISQTTFSRGKKKLSELLERSQLKLTNYVSDGIVGDEYKVRIFYFHFYEHFYYSLEWPFEDIRKEHIENTIKKELNPLFDNLTTNQMRKLYYVLSIIKKRMNHGYTVKTLPISFENHTQYEKIYAFVERYLSVHEKLDPQVIKNETHFFMCVLYTQDIIYLQTDYLTNLLAYSEDNPENAEINSLWIQTFKTLMNQDLTIDEELKWRQELNKFHLSSEFLYCDPTFFLIDLTNQKEKSFNKKIYQETSRLYQSLLKNKKFREFKQVNLKNITDEFMIDNYYYFIYLSFLNVKKTKPIPLFIADYNGKIDQLILTKKLELLFGKNIELIKKNTSTLTNLESIKLDQDGIIISSYQDEQSFKKVVHQVQEKIYAKFVDYED